MNRISQPTSRVTLPTIRVTDDRFTYARGADVQATWRRFGWVPPSEILVKMQQTPSTTSQL